MNSLRKAIYGALAVAALTPVGVAQNVSITNEDVRVIGDYLNVTADLVLDSLKLKSNHQMLITPMVGCDSVSVDLPSVLISGRNMHLSYLRGVLDKFKEIKDHDIRQEVERKNGQSQSISYTARIPVEPWMKSKGARLTFVYDSCGCGTKFGQRISPEIPFFENPVEKMTARMLPAPTVMEVPIDIHEGKARVQFEVDRTELHEQPYRCKNGQRIDNREQIAMIDDSVKYALSDPNVEIAEIRICGYASPESPYLHNEELSTGRSKALAEYLADRYSLPRGSVKYSAVPENWVEFREQVVGSNEISEEERKLLLELIDAPASTPEEYDAKEKMLKTDKRYSKLYKTKILPEWFPRLRATTFAIHTRLKPLDDEKLAEVIKTTPEKMSLNQMFRVANLYTPGSKEFNDAIATALQFYPTNEIAIINAATAAILDKDYKTADELLKGVPNTPEVYNLLGLIATAEERFDAAEEYFKKSGTTEAERNLQLLK